MDFHFVRWLYLEILVISFLDEIFSAHVFSFVLFFSSNGTMENGVPVLHMNDEKPMWKLG